MNEVIKNLIDIHGRAFIEQKINEGKNDKRAGNAPKDIIHDHTAEGVAYAHGYKSNKYGNLYGCHTPELTAQFCELLTAAGIPFSDESWNNDECDRIETGEFIVSIGKDKNLYPEFSENILMNNDEDNSTVMVGTFVEIVAYLKSEHGKIKCDQCTAAMINGVFAHETGCPNARKKWNSDREEWVKVFECHECGCMIEEGEQCTCMEDI